ncbi:MAG: hypothetical protein JKX98_04385 [Alcanivoracaceae bacterium]|nr:hypothetical protein [Alcanivoracaceae bacterium]
MIKYISQIVLLLLMVNLLNCSNDEKLTKKQILLQSIEQLEQRFEARNLSDIIEYVSEDYQDESGRELRDIKRAIQIQIMRHKSLYVFSTIKDIQWTDEGNATVEIVAAMGGKPMESASILTAVRADMIKFTVDFILEDEIYKVKSAQWSWADPADFL